MAKMSLPEGEKCGQEKLYPDLIKGCNTGLRGMLGILARDGDTWGSLSDEELATVHNQACNIIESHKNVIETIGNLLSAHDRTINDVDNIMVGWSIRTSMEDLQVMDELRSEVKLELARRGYNKDRDTLAHLDRCSERFGEAG